MRPFAGVFGTKHRKQGMAATRKEPGRAALRREITGALARERVNDPQGLLDSAHEVGVVSISIQTSPGHWQSVPQAALPAVSSRPPSVLAARAGRNVFLSNHE